VALDEGEGANGWYLQVVNRAWEASPEHKSTRANEFALLLQRPTKAEMVK